jgi:hypothetical protein
MQNDECRMQNEERDASLKTTGTGTIFEVKKVSVLPCFGAGFKKP